MTGTQIKNVEAIGERTVVSFAHTNTREICLLLPSATNSKGEASEGGVSKGAESSETREMSAGVSGETECGNEILPRFFPHTTLPLNEPLVFPAPPPVLLHTVDHKMFPVRRVFCVGRNYREHAKQMGFDDPLANAALRDEDFIFFEKDREAAHQMRIVPYPSKTSNLQHEVELVVAIGKEVRPNASHILDCVYGYAVGVDLARRDLHATARKLGRPWEEAKSFPFAAPIGLLHPSALLGKEPTNERITLHVNGTLRQEATLDQMIWNIEAILKLLTESESLEPGDIIFTGTPTGVGALQVGDVVTATIEKLGTLEFVIGDRLDDEDSLDLAGRTDIA